MKWEEENALSIVGRRGPSLCWPCWCIVTAASESHEGNRGGEERAPSDPEEHDDGVAMTVCTSSVSAGRRGPG